MKRKAELTEYEICELLDAATNLFCATPPHSLDKCSVDFDKIIGILAKAEKNAWWMTKGRKERKKNHERQS